jgi:methyltransferase (TIGR00027 family)
MLDTAASLELFSPELTLPADAVAPVGNDWPHAAGQPVPSAESTALLRALAAREPDEWLRCHDTLAHHFVGPARRLALRLPRRLCLSYTERAHPGTYGYILARTNHLDAVACRCLGEEVSQLVVLGAGYDTRAQRLAGSLRRLRVFEVDLQATQIRKRTLLSAARIAGDRSVRYVPLDLERQSLEAGLLAAGYELGRRTMFLAEGLLYYLTPRAVDRLLACVARNARPGSSIAFDYAVQSFADGDLSGHGARKAARWFSTAGEPCLSAIADEGIARFLSIRGFCLVTELGPQQLERGYLSRDDGTLAYRSLGMFRVAHARVAG